jgi:hypothetical protein
MNHHPSQLSIAVMQVAALAEPRFEVKYQNSKHYGYIPDSTTN